MPKMVIVPAEATEEMRYAALRQVPNPGPREIYAAMTAASPLAGKVSRGVLREAASAANRAFVQRYYAEEWRPDIDETGNLASRAAEDALAAALGLEVAED